MYCSKCGQKLNDGDVFCNKCGNRVVNAPDTSDTPVTPVTPVVEQNASAVEVASTVAPPTAAADSAASVPMVKAGHAAQTGAKHTMLKPGLKLPPKKPLKLPPKKPETGTGMASPSQEKSPDGKSRLAYQILALTLGWLGMHNFYARRIKQTCFQIVLTGVAVAMLVTQVIPVPLIGILLCIMAWAWPLLEIFTVHKDGKERPWGEDFVSAPGIESIDAMVLAKFRCNKRRCVLALVLVFIATGVVGVISSSDMGAGAVAVMALCAIAFLCLLVLPWYYHARSKGYAVGYSLVLALLGVLGMIIFLAGAGNLINCINIYAWAGLMHPGNLLLDGILLPIAAYRVARYILLKNGFKALSSAKKALIVAAIVCSFVIAVAGAFCAARVMETMETDGAVRQYNMGVVSMEREEYENAVRYFRKAAEQGHAQAQNNLGVCYANGKGVEKDVYEAVKWYRKAAEQRYVLAQYNLGVCYENGKGVEKDVYEAVKWYRKAAEQKYASAQFNLGGCYANGAGVEKDMDKAVKWYRKAAEQKCAPAQNNLGVCYKNGKGVEKDVYEAVKWYRKAAEQGDAQAQFNLGVCYISGAGVVPNKQEAMKWIRKAAEQGHPQAKEILEN